MHKEGFTEFDLTPGGIDGYKKDLATGYYDTYEVTITSTAKKFKIETVSTIKDFIKKKLDSKGAQFLKMNNIGKIKNSYKRTAMSFIKEGPSTYLKKKKAIEEPTLDAQVFSLKKLSAAAPGNKTSCLRKNRLEDLLLFSEKESVITKREFLFDAMKRFDFGHQVYTL